ncbi:UNVERIFIED_CONTAM: hypothetical protein Sradi_7021600 [Sesamum radiatum]|uniref:Reverse transcriptase domain-containing protein n=1 Tax=Sesamum radiatum TaxID=300843 RepID=A0AAW2JBM7_SESRA
MDVEPVNDAALIQFDQKEQNGPGILGNDALVNTTLLANYETKRVHIDSGSSADILFGEAYDQMRLGDAPLEAVDTSLYGFDGEVVHPRGMISLPLTLGTSPLRKTCLLKFLVVDVPSAYNVILGRLTLNAFQTIISTYHLKIKFPVVRGVGEAQADMLQARKCYVEAMKKGKKSILEETLDKENPSKRGKDPMPGPKLKEEDLVVVQPVEELLTVELIPGDPDKITKIESKMKEDDREQVVNSLQKNKDIFAWTPQDLEGIDLGGITHHLNIFPEWLSNVVIVPKPGGKWRMYKACPKKYYPLPRIDQLVDSTSRCELLSMMDASQGYHQIMLGLEDQKKKKGSASSPRTACSVTWPCLSG